MKTISKERRPQNIKGGISQQPLIGSCSNFKLILKLNHILQILKMKTTSNGRRPQNTKSGMSQQTTFLNSQIDVKI